MIATVSIKRSVLKQKKRAVQSLPSLKRMLIQNGEEFSTLGAVYSSLLSAKLRKCEKVLPKVGKSDFWQHIFCIN